MDRGSFFSILAISVASNLDNAGVGVAYGVKNIRIPFLANAVIALIGFLFTLVGGLFGDWISLWLSPFLCNVIGMMVLVTIGIWIVSQPLREKRAKRPPSHRHLFMRIFRHPEEAEMDGSRSIGFMESIILGVVLSINNVAGGFDTGLMQLNIWATSLISGAFSFFCVGFCAYLGARFAAEKLGKHANLVSGALLILVGLHQGMGFTV